MRVFLESMILNQVTVVLVLAWNIRSPGLIFFLCLIFKLGGCFPCGFGINVIMWVIVSQKVVLVVTFWLWLQILWCSMVCITEPLLLIRNCVWFNWVWDKRVFVFLKALNLSYMNVQNAQSDCNNYKWSYYLWSWTSCRIDIGASSLLYLLDFYFHPRQMLL